MAPTREIINMMKEMENNIIFYDPIYFVSATDLGTFLL